MGLREQYAHARVRVLFTKLGDACAPEWSAMAQTALAAAQGGPAESPTAHREAETAKAHRG